ncbi:exosortase K [Dysgonomonas sp. 521]|uniref:exosortase K n=1 Tax=Dysgonomonas sp. 521 TaxID=2302932 RepID=UPI0013D1BC2C|nr:exosortase K [Dysgonomonas sp. 521]NDV96858.1 exosortase K [Dysgonomonas sp. 521]
MKNSFVYLSICLVIFIGLKFIFPYLSTGALQFLLAPTNKIISFIFNSTYTYSSETGYFYPHLDIVINKSCSGFNFFFISFLMYSFLIIKAGIINKWLKIPFALCLAYATTIVANVSRIAGYMVMMNIQSPLLSLSGLSWLHQAEGIVVYLTFLVIAYLTFNHILNKIEHKYEKATQS